MMKIKSFVSSFWPFSDEASEAAMKQGSVFRRFLWFYMCCIFGLAISGCAVTSSPDRGGSGTVLMHFTADDYGNARNKAYAKCQKIGQNLVSFSRECIGRSFGMGTGDCGVYSKYVYRCGSPSENADKRSTPFSSAPTPLGVGDENQVVVHFPPGTATSESDQEAVRHCRRYEKRPIRQTCYLNQCRYKCVGSQHMPQPKQSSPTDFDEMIELMKPPS
jgi:hypothetical protein